MSKTSIIIGIDPGTKCGWAVRDGSGIIQAGTWALKQRDDERTGERYYLFRCLLGNLLQAVQPVYVVYEDVKNHKGVEAAHMYGGFVAILMAECEKRHIKYIAVPVGTVKKRATGNGNADKPKMVRAAKRQWPGFNGDDNEADARWIAEVSWLENEFAIKSGLYGG